MSSLSRKFHVSSFGCRTSQSEGAAIEEELRAAGATGAASPYDADVVVLNSCTVTAEADRDVRRLIRRIGRRNPEAQILVTGCYAQRRPEELAALPGVRYVVGNSRKTLAPALALERLADPGGPGRAEVFCSDVFGRDLAPAAYVGSGGRTRATVKVQDGCNANCSFCIIPTVRGRSRSLEPGDVVALVRNLTDRGYREVVFSGIHLGSYGRDLAAATRLPVLIRRVLDEVPELDRLRLSSIEPLEVTADLVALIESEPRIARHLHVPLQSGSPRMLRAMRRPYRAEDYADLIVRIRAGLPDAAIGADVMVGFPGETDEDFMQTHRLIEAAPLTYLHVFPYSARPGTAAAAMADPIPEHVSRFRARRLRGLISRKNLEFRRRFVGRPLQILPLDEASDQGLRPALSDNFIRVRAPERLAVNRWHEVRITAIDGAGLLAGER